MKNCRLHPAEKHRERVRVRAQERERINRARLEKRRQKVKRDLYIVKRDPYCQKRPPCCQNTDCRVPESQAEIFLTPPSFPLSLVIKRDWPQGCMCAGRRRDFADVPIPPANVRLCVCVCACVCACVYVYTSMHINKCVCMHIFRAAQCQSTGWFEVGQGTSKGWNEGGRERGREDHGMANTRKIEPILAFFKIIGLFWKVVVHICIWKRLFGVYWSRHRPH